ncbi:MAG: asparagine synthase C-terminal domain-containing protein [Gammaproteobacteria bacterium]|nr:asparagine synthase [Pseudomonadales bacterium]
MLAQFRIDAIPCDTLCLLNPEKYTGDLDIEEAFIVARDFAQNESGVTVSLIGEPYEGEDPASGDINFITAEDFLALYASRGRAGLTHLKGRWAAIIVDSQQKCVLLVTDRMGRQPLYYRISQEVLLVGSSLANLRTCAGETGLDTQALYNYIYFHMVPAPVAIIGGFQKLGAAGILELTRQGRKLSRYWIPSFKEQISGSATRAQEELRVHLKSAVQRCTFPGPLVQNGSGGGTDVKIGAFLSGGLDSSTVAGMLSEVQEQESDAYAIGFDAEGYDEMSYARLAARYFGIRLHEHYVTPDEVVEALPEIAAASDEPFGNSSVLPAYFCARLAAEDGVDMLLAGDGGDELFAGNERYAKQRIFESYRRVPQWLRGSLIEPLVRNLPGQLPLVSKGHSFLRQANTPLPKRLQYYGFLEQNCPSDVFSPEFLRQVDQTNPLTLLEEIYEAPENASVLNRLLFLDWQITLADNDLRKVDLACALAGVAVRYPMLDDDLVAFSSSIPSTWKLAASGTQGEGLRHFYKQAMKGWLPEETIRKTKHGFGLPFGVWMKTHKPLQELAYDNILKLKGRGIFLQQFLDQAIANHRDGHASYFGELIWVLMSLEMWLAVNEPDYCMEPRS